MDGAEATLEAVKGAPTPELAAWTGRRATRVSPLLQRPDWDSAKLEVEAALLGVVAHRIEKLSILNVCRRK